VNFIGYFVAPAQGQELRLLKYKLDKCKSKYLGGFMTIFKTSVLAIVLCLCVGSMFGMQFNKADIKDNVCFCCQKPASGKMAKLPCGHGFHAAQKDCSKDLLKGPPLQCQTCKCIFDRKQVEIGFLRDPIKPDVEQKQTEHKNQESQGDIVPVKKKNIVSDISGDEEMTQRLQDEWDNVVQDHLQVNQNERLIDRDGLSQDEILQEIKLRNQQRVSFVPRVFKTLVVTGVLAVVSWCLYKYLR
jgi:uncharacterized protein YneF (UPF0154 family)